MNSNSPSRSTYAVVWAALLLLLLLTWGLAQFELGHLNIVAALGIAVVKMMLVILFFMHVRYKSRLTWLFVAAGFIWFVIMVDLTLSDYMTRGAVPGMYRKSFEHGRSAAPVREDPDKEPHSRR